MGFGVPVRALSTGGGGPPGGTSGTSGTPHPGRGPPTPLPDDPGTAMPTSGPVCGPGRPQMVPRGPGALEDSVCHGEGQGHLPRDPSVACVEAGGQPMTWPGPLPPRPPSPVCACGHRIAPARRFCRAAEFWNFLQTWLGIPQSGGSCAGVHLGPNSWDLCISRHPKTLVFVFTLKSKPPLGLAAGLESKPPLRP